MTEKKISKGASDTLALLFRKEQDATRARTLFLAGVCAALGVNPDEVDRLDSDRRVLIMREPPSESG